MNTSSKIHIIHHPLNRCAKQLNTIYTIAENKTTNKRITHFYLTLLFRDKKSNFNEHKLH